jgi:chromosome segregation ATPase
MSRTISSSRMRKSDIDEAKRQAAKYLKIQNDLNNDPRRAENPREVKEHTDKVESLKADIKEITDVLQDLRKCAEEQNAIDMLEHQVTQDMELVEEMKNENSFLLQQYNTEIPLTGSSDRELMSTMETLAGEVGDKYDTSTRSVESSSEVLKESESRFSELSALLNQNKNTLGRRKEQLAALVSQGRGVQRIKNVIKDVRQYEQQNWGESLVSATTEPQQLLEHFTTKLGELATENDQPESVSRTITKLRKMAKRKDASGNLIGIICPCCTRSLDAEEAQTFKENMETLADVTNSPIVQMDLDRAGMSATATR